MWLKSWSIEDSFGKNLYDPPCVFAYCSLILSRMHTVYMSFQYRAGWRVSFLEMDLRTPLRRVLCFQDSAKLIELVERAGGFRDLEHRQSIENAITIGRGGTYLQLREEQYRKFI